MKKILCTYEKRNKGITLISLVVTIIVLIILAGVSINMLVGESNIIDRVNNDKNKISRKIAEEQIEIIVIESSTSEGYINLEKLNENLMKIDGIIFNNEKISNTNKITEVPATITFKGYEIEIKQNVIKIINELKDFFDEENSTDEEIIVDKEKLEILLQNTQAIDYIIDKKELLTLINQKEELKELFLNNNLAMSKLSQEVNEDEGLVPNLTSNTAALNGEECGEATESSEWYGRSAYKAFNRNVEKMEIGNCWQATDKAPSEGTYIQYKSLTEDTILNVKIGTWDDNTKNTDTSWTTYIRGSQDGQNWTKISKEREITVEKNVLKYFEYEINDFKQYKYYQVYFSGSQNNTEYVHRSYEYSCSIMFLQFYGIKNNDLLNYYVNS